MSMRGSIAVTLSKSSYCPQVSALVKFTLDGKSSISFLRGTALYETKEKTAEGYKNHRG